MVVYPLEVRRVVRSMQFGGLIGLIYIPASAPQVVYQRPWYAISWLCDGAYKLFLAANWRE